MSLIVLALLFDAVCAWSQSHGRIAFIRDESLLVYDFESKRERTLATEKNLEGPRWSPDGRFLSVKSRGNLKILQLSGEPPIALDGIPRTAVTHWIDNERLLIMLERPYAKPKIGTIENEEKAKGIEPAWYYGLYRFGDEPSLIKWGVLTGGGASRKEGVRDRASALDELSRGTQDKIVCILDSVDCFIKTTYPYLLPQKTTFGVGLVFAGRPEEGVNIFLDYHSGVVKKISAADSDLLMKVIQPGPMWVDPNSGYYPSWSPSGKGIAYSAWVKDIGEAVFLLPSSASRVEESKVLLKRTSNRRSLKGYFLESFKHPRWSPDGRYLVSTHTRPKSINPLSDEVVRFIHIYDTQTESGSDLLAGRDPDWALK